MTAHESLTTGVVEALRDGLAAAKREGATSVQATHLIPEQLEALAAATLAHLRSRPGKPSPVEGWTLVTTRSAGVLSWWVEIAGLSGADRRRLGSLRHDVYDVLAEQHLIATDPGRNASVHVSPSETAREAVAPAEPPVVDPAGAWVLKLSPYVYDVNTVFAAPDGRVGVWSVEQGERAASMEPGQPVYLWVDEGDAFREAGVWGVGRVAGQCVSGVADGAWLDHEAASRATVFAVVDITLLDRPVSRAAFLDDARLAGAEVIHDRFGPNPGILCPSEVEALSEHLTSVLAQSEPQVA
jgi:hypothetical protein